MDSSKPKVLFVLGGPGSGKGTQCENLVERYQVPHFSTGDLLRAEVKTKSDLGKEIQSFISKGEMVPGEVAVNLIRKNILKLGENSLVVIDGYPRN